MGKKASGQSKGVGRRRFLKSLAIASSLAFLRGDKPRPHKFNFRMVGFEEQDGAVKRNFHDGLSVAEQLDPKLRARLNGREITLVFMDDLRGEVGRSANEKLKNAFANNPGVMAFTDYNPNDAKTRVFFDSSMFKDKALAINAIAHELFNAANAKKRFDASKGNTQSIRHAGELETFTYANGIMKKLLGQETAKLAKNPGDKNQSLFVQNIRAIIEFNDRAIESWK